MTTQELQDQINQLQAQLDQMKAKEEKAEWPQAGDDYWWVASDGDLGTCSWGDYPGEQRRKNTGNIFRTEEDAESEVKRRESMAKRWRPKVGDDYWWVASDGDLGTCSWGDYPGEQRRKNTGNIFRTEEDAESEVKRRESMAKRWRPKDDKNYWFYRTEDGDTRKYTWENDSRDLTLYFMGNCHPTMEAAEAWGKEYWPHFEKLLQPKE